MKKLKLAILGLVALGCNFPAPEVKIEETHPKYLRDPRTGLCFAVGGSGHGLGSVPCAAVERAMGGGQ